MRKPLLLLSVTVLVLVGLYAAAGYWLLPGYVRQRLVAEAERLGYPLRLEAVRVDPFRLNVELKGAELAISDEARVIAPRVRADLKLASLLARDFLPRRVSLSGGVIELADSRIQPLEATLTRQPGGYRIASDGALSLQGDLVLAPLRLDAEVSASAVPLAAAQPWVSRLARLELASGLASARGRVRFDSTGSPRFAYEGTLSLKDVVLRGEEAGAAPLASWQSLDGTDVALSLAPNRLQVGEALLQGAAGRLVIGENRRTNLARIGKAGQGKSGAAPFPVALRRLTVRGGRLDFADLSLEPRFATTIRELSGTVSGLGSDGDDEARISVTMSFRNLEMKSLTPYTAKFAGYRIESGKLSADLRYRVRDSQLVGDNKLVIDSLVLGEHVESAQAPDLPVELAIALLTDARGRIELGLPVRGDLSDPEFSFAQLAGKVLGNLLERMASAPFRLLGSLLGGGSERDLDGILFEPGSARLAPPQQENAAALAKALAARPHISLAVRGGYDSEADTAALRGLALRRELVKRSGFRLRSGEDPGSLDPSDPRTRQAMETLYIEHGGTAMRMREIRRAAEGNERRYLRTLGEEVSAKMPLPQDAGEALARDRAEAVRAALLGYGVAAERVRIGDLESATAGENGVRTAVAFDAGQSAGSGR
jgi:outer membrane protein OmpA-like peptidoglycan-associated protein